MTIELITFDLDDTLWDTAPVIVSAEAVLRHWLGDNAPKLGVVDVGHFQAIRERVLNEEPQLKHRISALRRRILFHALNEAGYVNAAALADDAFEVFIEARHALDVFPQAEPTLIALASDSAWVWSPMATPMYGESAWGTTSNLCCVLKTSASPSRMRACFTRRCCAVAWRRVQRCTWAITRETTLPEPSRRACERCGSTRAASTGTVTKHLMPRLGV